MSIKYIQGDLLNSDCDIIGHGCNCFNNMGSGIAWQIRQQMPEVYEADFFETEMGDRAKLGGFTKAFSKGKMVYNIYSQYKYGHDKVFVEYDHLERALELMREDIKRNGDYENCKIGLPLIGCGLAGGDWNIVSKIIEMVFKDKDIYVYKLEDK